MEPSPCCILKSFLSNTSAGTPNTQRVAVWLRSQTWNDANISQVNLIVFLCATVKVATAKCAVLIPTSRTPTVCVADPITTTVHRSVVVTRPDSVSRPDPHPSTFAGHPCPQHLHHHR